LVPLYLDDCLIQKEVARQLRAAGHLIYVPTELRMGGQSDEQHLELAAALRAVIATQNQRDFAPLHRRWQEAGRTHAGILLTHQIAIGERIERLERAARLLTVGIAWNKLIMLDLFRTEEAGRAFIESLME
jgi:hypothetical protein